MVCFAYLVRISGDLSGCICQSAEAGFGRRSCGQQETVAECSRQAALYRVPQTEGLFSLSEGTEDVHNVCGTVLSIERDSSLQNERVSKYRVPPSPHL